jgi:hypothetical protein
MTNSLEKKTVSGASSTTRLSSGACSTTTPSLAEQKRKYFEMKDERGLWRGCLIPKRGVRYALFRTGKLFVHCPRDTMTRTQMERLCPPKGFFDGVDAMKKRG